MDLKIRNCNNIDYGELEIDERRLNIKYAINGTGKSTISKAIDAFVHKDEEKQRALLPFKYYGQTETNQPELSGVEHIDKIAVFNESFLYTLNRSRD